MPVQARERLLLSAITLGRRDGWAAMSVAGVLAESGAARRSFYSHFPGGTAELTVAAVQLSADWITAAVVEACDRPLPQALTTFVDHWSRLLVESDFELGCPVAAAALSRARHPEAAEIAVRAFGHWESVIAEALVRDGARADVATTLATMTVAGIEGAVVRCVADRSVAPLTAVHDHLQSMLVSTLA